MSSRKWNIDDAIGIELYVDDNDVVREARNDSTNIVIQRLLGILSDDVEKTGELVIQYNSRGYSEPASLYGGSQQIGWPAEGEDYRTLLCVELITEQGKIQLEEPFDQDVFEWYTDDVEAADPFRERW